MKITILITGKTSDSHCAALLQEYSKRLKKYCDCRITELPDMKHAVSSTPRLIREKELTLQQKCIDKQDYLILLDETGKQNSSAQFADFISKKQLENRKHLLFLIGGSYGFAEALYARADDKISLSAMTFPHQLVRVIFAEQLYRAFTILNNEQYHH